jgi:ribose 5-phosphate isomerase A
MAQQFECFEDDCDFSEWAETEDEVLEEAKDHLQEHDLSVPDEEIRKHIRTVPSPKRIKSSPEEIMDERRERGGTKAAEVVEDGMIVGLGTGSTTAWAIAELGARVDDGLDIHGVATSLQSHELAKEAGVPLINLDEVSINEIDVAIDGADQYSPDNPHVVKGGGASHAREKVIDTAADRLVIASDEEKAKDPLDHPVPLSVLPDSRTLAMDWVRDQGGTPDLRYAERKDGPLYTANGNLVIDCDFGPIGDPSERAQKLSAIPGAQEHGLFVDMVDDLYIGTSDGVETIQF